MGRHSAPASPPEPAEPSAAHGRTPAPESSGTRSPGAPPRDAPPDHTSDDTSDDTPDDAPDDAPDGTVSDRVARTVLAVAAGLATLFATSWAGLPWRDAGIAGLAAAALVVVSAWISGTMPQRPTPYSDARERAHPDE